MRNNIYTIPAGEPFLPSLVDGVLTLAGGKPERLPEIKLYLPTRRACREVRTAFTQAFNGRPTLLPSLHPLGDVDPDEIIFRLSGYASAMAEAEIKVPPAISPLQRTLILSRLVREYLPDRPADAAVTLAEELGRLMDHIYTQGLRFEDMSALVEADNLARHWQITLDFLTILSCAWPEILDEKGRIDAVDRRNRLLRLLTGWYEEYKPETVTIAAGSTGSIPAVSSLLRAISSLPQGYIILPGFDPGIERASWESLEPTHPQYGMKNLLAALEKEPRHVKIWPRDLQENENANVHKNPPENPPEHPGTQARRWLCSEIMRPAATLDKWASLRLEGSKRHALTSSLEGLKYVICTGPEQEARLISVLIRQTLEVPGKTCAVVTPDRDLARRICAACRRWRIDLDDSAGTPLAWLRSGSWLLLTAGAVLQNFRPLSLMAMLKHPLASSILSPTRFRLTVRQLERTLLRNSGTGMSAGKADVAGISPFTLLRERLSFGASGLLPEEAGAIVRLLEEVEQAGRTLGELFQASSPLPFNHFLNAHIDMAERLAGGTERLWLGEDGESAALLLAELNDYGHVLGNIDGREYIALLRQFLEGQAVRPLYGTHPRIAVLGQLEARLMHADLVIAAGLNEGTWPRETQSDPWMSRPMRNAFGLPDIDEDIGRSAHDFAQLLSMPEVVLTRSARVDGSPTVPARWLQRMEAVLKALNTDPDKDLDKHNPSSKDRTESGGKKGVKNRNAGGGNRILTLATDPCAVWAELLDRAPVLSPAPQPQPTPPIHARPRSLAVTSIETWMRDPYALYARKILRLKKLDPLEKEAEAAEFGSWIHHVLYEFVTRNKMENKASLPSEAENELRRIGRTTLGPAYQEPRIRAFWWPRFEKIIRWYVEQEVSWRQYIDGVGIALESKGECRLEAAGGDFLLSATVDRIDRVGPHEYALIDYKTGAVPAKKEVLGGIAPQLSLEALILEKNGFSEIPCETGAGTKSARARILTYWQMSGTPSGTGEQRYEGAISFGGESWSIRDIVDAAESGLKALIEVFDRPETPYLSLPRPQFAPREEYQDYAQLARVKEWSTHSGGLQEGDT